MNANTHTHTLAEMQSDLETADKRNKTQTGRFSSLPQSEMADAGRCAALPAFRGLCG